MQRLFISVLIIIAIALPVKSAFAIGTAAGTAITNQATATYTVGTSQVTETSNQTTTTVAELIDMTVTWQDASNISVAPSDQNKVLTFLITNTGNGSDIYTLAGLSTLSGDGFDPTLVDLYLDSNGDGVYIAADDAQYIPGTNDPTLAADASITVFVLNDIPAGLTDGDLGNSQVTATSQTGTGSPGDVIAGAGEGGTDAVVGTSGGDDSYIGMYVVSNVVVAAVKSASNIVDPFGGSESIPGSVITYTITITVTGSGTAKNMVITDPIPANTSYDTGTLTLNSVSLSDAAGDDDGDVGNTTANTVTVSLGDLTSASSVQTITFDVTIN